MKLFQNPFNKNKNKLTELREKSQDRSANQPQQFQPKHVAGPEVRKAKFYNNLTYSIGFLVLVLLVSVGVLYYFSSIQTKDAKASDNITIVDTNNIDLASTVCTPDVLKQIADETTCVFKLKGGQNYSLPRLNFYGLLNQNFKKDGNNISGALGFQSYTKGYIDRDKLILERIPLRPNTFAYSDNGQFQVSDKIESLKTGPAKITIVFGKNFITSTNEPIRLERN